MADTPERLAERLQADGEKTAAFFRALAPEQWRRRIYTTGEPWTVHQVMAHFVSSEESFGRLIENILQGGQGAPDGFDIDAFNESQVAALNDALSGHLIERYLSLREGNIRLVASMQPEDLEKKGRHPFLGTVPLEETIKLLYRHNQIHLRDLRRALEAR